jgi:alkanesulfonate monooxygenase SsuD/methylene tetrahydromethanopterin reductase-like flavin-dependent oxidoreductase (luciferase family)
MQESRVEIGIGLDPSVGLNYEEQAQLSKEAAQLGYKQIWTPEGSGEDAFQTCGLRWNATREVVDGGIGTGIGVAPVAMRTPMGFAMSAGTLSKMSGGKFILGIGSGQADVPAYRRNWNLRGTSTLALMRDYLTVVRALVRGETVDYTGPSIELHGAKLGINPPPATPVYLAALGPQMLRLGGECADGLCLNWCSPEQVALSRELVAEGAERAGRDPSKVGICEYIRVCIDEDEEAARKAYTRAMMGYALGRLGDPPRSYRAHFERMGFAEDLRRIDEMRSKDAPVEEQVDAFPKEMCLAVGYFGKAEGAAAHFRKLAEGLDIALVRIVASKPGMDAGRAVIKACAPAIAM